jgi:hypothetical protein
MTLYLDTSSLVKLYVAEPGSEAVHKLVDAATVVATSTVAYTETRAALARRRRERALLRPHSCRPRRRSKPSGPSGENGREGIVDEELASGERKRAFANGLGGEEQCFADVFRFKVRIESENLLRRLAFSDQGDDRRDRNP